MIFGGDFGEFKFHPDVIFPLLFALLFLSWLVLFFYRDRSQKLNWQRVLLILALAFGILHAFSYNLVMDDAFISLRYADNFARGLGLVFNPGERVEGYSNFLWTITLGLLNRYLGLPLLLTSRILGALSFVGIFFLSYSLLRSLGHRPVVSVLPSLFFAGSIGLTAHSINGMATVPFGFFLLWTLERAIRRDWFWAGLAFSLAALIRLEGVLTAFPLGFWLLINSVSGEGSLRDRLKNFSRALWRCFALPFVILSIWTAWRLTYYGSFWPNAVLAKAQMPFKLKIVYGLSYLRNFIFGNIELFLIFFIAIGWRLFIRRIWKLRDALFGSFLVLYFAFTVLVGGDWMLFWRYLVPYLPVLAVWTVDIIFRDPPPQERSVLSFLLPIAAGLIIVVSSSNRARWISAANYRAQIEGLSFLGKWFGETLPKDTLLATFASGALPFYSRLPAVDMLGLTDQFIALFGQRFWIPIPGHVVFDYKYVLSRGPDIIEITGQGFQKTPVIPRKGRFIFSRNYQYIYFKFPKGFNRLGQYLGFWILRRKKQALLDRLKSYKKLPPSVQIIELIPKLKPTTSP